MNFIYAVNNESVLSAAVLERTGLGGILKNPGEMPAVSSIAGPGGGRCVLFGDMAVKDIRFLPDKQKWLKSYNEKYHVGYYLDSPPSAAELARKKQLAGHKVELGDGKDWLIPVARKFAEGSVLPLALGIGAKGEIIVDELEEYIGFSGRAARYYRETLRQALRIEVEPMEIDDQIKLAIEAIMLNYHISIQETFILKLINSVNMSEICGAVIDTPSINAVAKQMAEDKKKVDPANTPE